MSPSASSWREGIPPLPLTVDAREDGAPIGWQTLAQILPTPKGNVVGALKRRVGLPRANREGGAFWDGEAGNGGRASDGLPMRNPSTDCVGKSQVHTHRPIVRLPSGWRRDRQLTFTAGKRLRDGAYLKLGYMPVREVVSWEEVQPDQVPDAARERLA